MSVLSIVDRETRERLMSRLRSEKRKLAVTTGPSLLWLALFLLAPVALMTALSFARVNPTTFQVIWEPNLESYRALFQGGTFTSIVLLSFKIAVVTTIITMALAFPVAYALVTRLERSFGVVIFLVLLPFFTMYIVRAYSWLLLFGDGGILNTVFRRLGLLGTTNLFPYGEAAVVVGLVHAYFPYMLLSLYASLDGVDFALVEAARDLGASRVETFVDVIFPLVLPGMIAGSLFVFVPSLGAFITPRFLGQGKILMLGMYIEQRVGALYQVDYASAASMIIVLTILILFGLSFRYIDIEDLGGV
ncbi:ABC transporter permease [Halolamina sp. CBA1230]|uniref:ABC transporter permease n=1 Tax=Halolamina sp. CBA1230 TaxID=1853690 RepID=UPI0009A1E234|nr:ABC transporter permease [Halolamina sp. CBA1230]QKY20560.1 ABC transporter permease [Halolamina sp. CBA1230]